jgi:hypothetical protein
MVTWTSIRDAVVEHCKASSRQAFDSLLAEVSVFL